MQIIIDRFEGTDAIAEYTDGQGRLRYAKIEKILLPDAQEGDVIDITVNRGATEARARKIGKLMEDLFE